MLRACFLCFLNNEKKVVQTELAFCKYQSKTRYILLALHINFLW